MNTVSVHLASENGTKGTGGRGIMVEIKIYQIFQECKTIDLFLDIR